MKIKKACIIVPTFNEAENIPGLISQIDEQIKTIKGWRFALLVVDDSSPDGTAKVVSRQKALSLYRIHILSGKKRGLGTAYIRGMKWAIKNSFDYVFEMDADLSHSPVYLKDFCFWADKGFDFIIGSRYICGGCCLNWDIFRKALSKAGNKYINIVSRLKNVSDCTSGFRCISVKLLSKIELSRIKSSGYMFQTALLNESFGLGAKIKELPIIFKDRTKGRSKLGARDVFEFFIHTSMLWKR